MSAIPYSFDTGCPVRPMTDSSLLKMNTSGRCNEMRSQPSEHKPDVMNPRILNYEYERRYKTYHYEGFQVKTDRP